MQRFDWLSNIKMVKRTMIGLFPGPTSGMKRRHFVKMQHYARLLLLKSPYRVLPLLSTVFLSRALGDARHCPLGFSSTSWSWQVSTLPKSPQFSLFFPDNVKHCFLHCEQALSPDINRSAQSAKMSRNVSECRVVKGRISRTLYCAWRAWNSNFMVPPSWFQYYALWKALNYREIIQNVSICA